MRAGDSRQPTALPVCMARPTEPCLLTLLTHPLPCPPPDATAALKDFERVAELLPGDAEAEEDLDRCQRYMESDDEDELSE